MKVLAINGSGRKDGNTADMLGIALGELEKESIETEMIQLAGNAIRGCTACRACARNLDKKCVMDDDIVNDCIDKMIQADGIILGSPTYFANITAEMKALIDRVGLVTRCNGFLLRRKAGAAVVAVRRGGSIAAFDSINHLFLISEMIVPGSIYWNLGFGMDPGDVLKDEEGVKTMKVLGENMAWLLKKINA